MSTITKNTAEYYLGLNYSVALRKLAPEEGGGYMATIPQLGSKTFVGDGETPDEALESLESTKRQIIPLLLEDGVEIPEPDDPAFELGNFSGNVMLRLPKGLHARLATEAKRNATSINKLATELLAAGLATR